VLTTVVGVATVCVVVCVRVFIETEAGAELDGAGFELLAAEEEDAGALQLPPATLRVTSEH
jgi:hypothetical protein